MPLKPVKACFPWEELPSKVSAVGTEKPKGRQCLKLRLDTPQPPALVIRGDSE